MKAERERREAILRAEGEKRSAILVAEGEKEATILRADATGWPRSPKPKARPRRCSRCRPLCRRLQIAEWTPLPPTAW